MIGLVTTCSWATTDAADVAADDDDMNTTDAAHLANETPNNQHKQHFPSHVFIALISVLVCFVFVIVLL